MLSLAFSYEFKIDWLVKLTNFIGLKSYSMKIEIKAGFILNEYKYTTTL